MGLSRDAAVRLGAATVLTVVFAAGTALGFAIDRDDERAGLEPPGVTREEGQRRAGRPSDWIIDRLDLSSGQRERVDSVVDHYGALMSALQHEYRPQYRAIVDSTDHALREILSEGERARYDSLSVAAARWRARNRSNGRGR